MSNYFEYTRLLAMGLLPIVPSFLFVYIARSSNWQDVSLWNSLSWFESKPRNTGSIA